jgi:chromosome segregation ATPase
LLEQQLKATVDPLAPQPQRENLELVRLWAAQFERRFDELREQEQDAIAVMESKIVDCAAKAAKCVKLSEVEELSDLLDKAHSDFVSELADERAKHEVERSELVTKLRAAEAQNRELHETLDSERRATQQIIEREAALAKELEDTNARLRQATEELEQTSAKDAESQSIAEDLARALQEFQVLEAALVQLSDERTQLARALAQKNEQLVKMADEQCESEDGGVFRSNGFRQRPRNFCFCEILMNVSREVCNRNRQ